jgi:pimeloyl-ACP methyl ester carboxylesterase
MPTIKVNNTNFYYEEHGKGESLIMISGLAADVRALQMVIAQLAQKNRIIIFDNRGAGRTEVTPGLYTTQLLADDVAHLMSALAIERAHILGHSLGGAIAQHLALKYPQKINKLILMSTFIKNPVRTQQLINLTLNMLRQGISISLVAAANLPWLYSSHFISDEKKAAMVLDLMIHNPNQITLQGYESQAHACITHDTQQQLHQIKTETLVVCGDDDLITPLNQSEKIAAEISQAKLAVIPNVGHIPHIENPTAYTSLVTDFLR